MIKTIIEDSHDYVNTYTISFLFNEPLKSYGSLISQHFICSQYDISLQAMELHRLSWFNPFSKAFYNDIFFSKISLPHFRKFESDELLNFQLLLTNSYCKLIGTRSTSDYFPKLVWIWWNFHQVPKETYLKHSLYLN